MTNNHPSFDKPDENTIIWHYMDFTKFVSFLDKSALFFSTISILRLTDKHEGTYNEATVEASKQKPFSIHQIGSPLLREFGKLLAINCWHMNEIESVAMWNVYLKGNPGVAIQSTVKNLDSSIDDKLNVSIGRVHYLEEDDVIPEPDGFNSLNAALWKWKSYQYENELRAVVISQPEELFKYNGTYIPVNLNHLIQKIVISPKSPRWFSELVSSISSKYGLADKVDSSRLDMSPGNIDNNKLSVAITCPLCDTNQEILIEPYILREYPHNSTIIFSADRLTIVCQKCAKSLVINFNVDLVEENTS
jgi:hypothetical protein